MKNATYSTPFPGMDPDVLSIGESELGLVTIGQASGEVSSLVRLDARRNSDGSRPVFIPGDPHDRGSALRPSEFMSGLHNLFFPHNLVQGA